MKSAGRIFITRQIEIPEVFRNDDGGLFHQCNVCEKELLSGDVPYIIEKAMKRYEAPGSQFTAFEYAICMDCAQEFRKSMSADSLRKMDEYFRKNANFQGRWSQLGEETTKVDNWLSKCLFKGTEVSQLNEYQVCGQFRGSKMILSDLPFVISGAAMDEISELMSNQTLGEMDDFIDTHFGLPPEWKEAFKSGGGVLV